MLNIRFVVSILSAAMVLAAPVVSGQSYPNKTIRMLGPEAGSALDVTARILAPEIAGPLGQPVIVENRASSTTGQSLARSTPDGYTLAIGGSVLWLTPLTQKTSYDPVKDLAPITSVVSFPSVLVVTPSLAVKSVKELIDLAKTKPGMLNYAGSADVGAATFLFPELLKAMANVNIVRIPYKGSASAMTAVMAGESHMLIIAAAAAMPNVKAGKLNALAITSLAPSALVPGVPTIAATGLPGYEAVSITGVMAPAGTPAAIIKRLNQEIARVLSRADIKEKFASLGLEAAPSSPAQLAAMINADIAKWGKLIRDLGIKPES